MQIKKHSTLFVFLFFQIVLWSQNIVQGRVTDSNEEPINKVAIYNTTGGLLAETNFEGKFTFTSQKSEIKVIFYSALFKIKEVTIQTNQASDLRIVLNDFEEELNEITLQVRRTRVFELKRLNDVEGTSIYAGKKTEVILVDQSTANLATNNARQIFNQIPGLNIFENDDAGLQLNIGGRGLDPSRTSNFNTRQNGYDISADVLGYPESYYTPASEALKEIQMIRGAASLQYGTQFGGLINFVMKSPNPNKAFEIRLRNTVGSFGLYTNFKEISGTTGKFSYYAYANYKTGNGFRSNSGFDSFNGYLHLGYEFNDKTNISVELTYLDYLAQQAGGLTDRMFRENPFQSNRTRNWFDVDWFLYNFKMNHEFSEDSKWSFNFFGLNASRKSVGYRIQRVDGDDDFGARELLIGDFNNFGFETRFVNNYNIFGKKSTNLIGVKYYKANNRSFQGPGTDGSDANFSSAIEEFPDYIFQSDFDNPNQNLAVFSENIFYLNDKLSITPGIRFEYISTGSNGFKKRTNFDGAGNPIGSVEESDNIVRNRNFLLFGLGLSYKYSASLEVYGNISQNYRSITFSDVNIVNPSNAVDPNIEDEKGFTTDIGFRGNINQYISYDTNVFALFYNNRIGDFFTVLEPPVGIGNLGLLRTNIGKARILGIESLFDFNLRKILQMNSDYRLNFFINSSFISSEYIESIESGIAGNKVEFVPDVNIKTGLRFGYKDFLWSAQYTYLSKQFNDASNSEASDISNPVLGAIPAYFVFDTSLSYTYKYLKLETGINNLFDKSYYTRRTSGYPGPGIIPSLPRNYYLTLQISL